MFTLLRHANVYEPRALGLRDVLVCAERVVAIDERIEPPRGLQCESVDLHGRALIPGLFDLHVHSCGGGGESGPSSRVPPIALTELTTAGVTSCVGVLGTDTTTRTMESLVARTLGLRDEGISAWCWTGGYEVPPRTLTGSVRRDLVFVDPIVGAGEIAISDHRSSQPTLDELLRVAADCHVGGLMTGKAGVLHLHVGDGERGLDLVRRALAQSELPPRVFHPTHANRKRELFEEAKELAGRGVTIDVTAFPVGDGDPALCAEDAIERWLDEGLPRDRLTCSSDGAGCLPVFDADGRLCAMDVGRPKMLADTIGALVRRGRSLCDVLPFFTSNVAALLRLPRKGHVAAGGDADLVALGDDGASVELVIARGRVVVREGRPCVHGPFEGARR